MRSLGPAAGGAPPDVWTPIAEPIHLYRGRHYVYVVARLKDGVSIEQAQAEMDGVAAQIASALPQFSKGHGANVRPLHGELVADVRRALLILFAGVGLVLVIGCCNVANLLLARAASRQGEIAIRSALGAGRLRIARQLVAEGALLSIAGGAAGVFVAEWLLRSTSLLAPDSVPRLAEAGLNPRALAFAAAVYVATTIVFGAAGSGDVRGAVGRHRRDRGACELGTRAPRRARRSRPGAARRVTRVSASPRKAGRRASSAGRSPRRRRRPRSAAREATRRS